MAGDSLKWIVAPLPYSVFWAVLGVLLILLVVGWFVGVLVWTLPVERLRTIPVLRDISARVLQRKFSAAVGRVDERYRAGELNSRQAYAEMSRILRNFVYDRTGVRAQYMALGEVAHSSAAAAAPVVSALYARQFDLGDRPDVAVAVGPGAECDPIMELRWWWIVIVGLVALVVIVAVALFWRLRQQPRSLRPLAWVGRLTDLPEYVRAYRRYRILLAAIAATTVAVLLCAIVATARPVSSQATAAEISRAHPEDVMLCLQDSPASHDASVLLSYFRDKAATFDTQRLGLTFHSLRVIPLTRDYPFLQDRLGQYASLEKRKAAAPRRPRTLRYCSGPRTNSAGRLLIPITS